MKKKKHIILISILIFIFLVGFSIFTFFYLTNENRLNKTEKKFLADQATTVQNVYVLNNVNIYGNNGSGIFYDFLDDFQKEYGIKTNSVTYNLGENVTPVAFGAGNTLSEEEVSFYEDHYVLVSKTPEYISDITKITDKKIGVLKENQNHVVTYLNTFISASLVDYETNEELLKAFSSQADIQYMLVPLHLYANTILENNYSVAFHFSDLPYYYKIHVGTNNILGSIMAKYYNKWEESHLNDYYEDHLFNLFIKSMNISLADIDAMRSVTYHYGFVNNSPYEILSGGNYGGIVAQLLKKFTEFSDIDIKFNKYKNLGRLNKSIQSKKVNLYFEYYDLTNSLVSVPTGFEKSFDVLLPKENDQVIHSLYSLRDEVVYVEKSSILHTYLKNQTGLKIKTYETLNELKKLIKKEEIILVDSQVYETYEQKYFDSYSSRYRGILNTDYAFKANTSDTFIKLFTKFVNFADPNEILYEGLYNYSKTLKNGTITGTIAKYFMYLLIVFVIIFLYVYKVTKRVKVSKKIKKEDKLKYIDQLTSLKNRNYLTENMEHWGKNTIYPQTIIVVDLNNLQYINDTMGYEQGDVQIKGAANVLVKTQLDNSEIIRTDGNEFVVYLVGYQTKQITSYIHKLNKEFKKLPYEYGAAIGYSMIVDDIKSIEDAINEAVEDVKKQKESKKEADE